MAAVCPLHGGQTQILQCEKTTKICTMKISPPKQTEAHLKVCLVVVEELLIRSQNISTSFLLWNDQVSVMRLFEISSINLSPSYNLSMHIINDFNIY